MAASSPEPPKPRAARDAGELVWSSRFRRMDSIADLNGPRHRHGRVIRGSSVTLSRYGIAVMAGLPPLIQCACC